MNVTVHVDPIVQLAFNCVAAQCDRESSSASPRQAENCRLPYERVLYTGRKNSKPENIVIFCMNDDRDWDVEL